MGHYNRRPVEGERAGASERKRNKEIERGRIKRKSPQQFSISQRKQRLDDLQNRISREFDAKQREPLFEQFANLAASCPPEVFVPSEIHGIERYSDLAESKFLSSLDGNYYRGSRPDFLPLHHLVKLLSKAISQNENDKFIYLLGSTSTSTPAEPQVRNLRGLEYFLLTFAQRMSGGQYLDLEVNKKRVQVPHHNESFHQDSDRVVIGLRRKLKTDGITQSDHYTLRRIQDGNQRVGTNLHIITEQKSYETSGKLETVVISYLTTKI